MKLSSMKPPGFIYFVFAESVNLVKIGYSAKDPDIRFGSLLSSSPVALSRMGCASGNHEDEQSIHVRFSHLRHHGEWFECAPELLVFIKEFTTEWTKPEPRPRYSTPGIRWGKAVPIRKLWNAEKSRDFT